MAVPITTPESVFEIRARRRLMVHPCRRSLGREFRKAKVQNLGNAVAADDHVFRLDVPVHDAAGVRRGERIRDLDSHVQDVCERHWLRVHPFDAVLILR